MMSIDERVKLYKKVFKPCKALEALKGFVLPVDRIEALEALRELATNLSRIYMVSVPVITIWVRDDSYVLETGEIYLTEPELEAFLHQYRHHLQNVERKYERRGLTTEDNMSILDIPYKNCLYKMKGEDDARAWARFLIKEM